MAGEFNYDGEHSLIISGKHTWTDWHMAPTSRPYVTNPPVKESYVDIPGADGALDYTDVLTGAPRYGNRTGNWDFIVENGWVEPLQFQSELLKFLHGKKHDIILTDQPDYYYTGRLTLDINLGAKDYNSIRIKYNLDPYKRPIDSTATKAWKWNDLFGNVIRYGPFTVKNHKYRTLVIDEPQNVTITVTNPMEVIIDGMHIYLSSGDNTVELTAGNHEAEFIGTGKVVVDYSVGKML